MRKLIFTIFVLYAFTGIGTAQKKHISDPFFFIQITDPQFGMHESDMGFSKETILYEKAVEIINKLKPEFLVITGDLVNNKDNREQMTEFKRITSGISSEIPVFYSPGNHDIGQPPTQKDIEMFKSEYGHDRFSFKYKKNLFIGLNSCIIKANTKILEAEQFEWLKSELIKGKKARHIFIFTHYPFFINSFDEPESYSNIDINTRERYLLLFKEFNVDALFAGHLHNNASAKFGNIDVITTSAVGKPLAKYQSGFRIIKVYSNRMESEYYPLEKVPDMIKYE